VHVVPQLLGAVHRVDGHDHRAGDRVLLYMQNSPQWILAYYGILRADAVVVPVNPMHRTEELRHYVHDTGATSAFVAQDLVDPMQPLLGAAGLRHLVVATYGDYLRAATDLKVPDMVTEPRRSFDGPGIVPWQAMLAQDAQRMLGQAFDIADVARLRVVLAAQRDHYLPLRVIREQLAALDRGEPTAAVVRAALSPVEGRRALVAVDFAPPDAPESALLRLSREELLARSGLSDATLSSLEQQGMLGARDGVYDAEALAVAGVGDQLAQCGLEPRHLRGYRTSADHEVGLLAQLVAPMARQNTPAARGRAGETVREVAALSQQLHAALVRIGLRETLG